MKCPHCGYENPDWLKFCEQCDQPLDLSPRIKKEKEEAKVEEEKPAQRFSFDDEDSTETVGKRSKKVPLKEKVKEKMPLKKEEEKESLGDRFINWRNKIVTKLNGDDEEIEDEFVVEEEIYEEEPIEETPVEEIPVEETKEVKQDTILRPYGQVFSFDDDTTFIKEPIVEEEEEIPHESFEIKKKIDFKRIIIAIIAVCVVFALVFFVKSQFSSKSDTSTTTNTNTNTTNTVKNITVSSATATSVLNDSSSYKASNAIDGDPTTAWNEGVRGDGIGESITFKFDEKTDVKAAKIYNGYCKNETIYYKNNRLKEVTFIFDDSSESVTLDDSFNVEQKISFAKTHRTKKVTIRIESVYKGRSFRDTCLSDVSFQG